MKKIIIILFPILTFLICIFFKINFFFSSFLFFLLPAIILSYKNKKHIVQALAITTLMFPFFSFVYYLGTINNAWQRSASIFNVSVFNFFTIEDLIWPFFFNFFIAVIYLKYFNKNVRLINKKTKPLIFFSILMMAVTIFMAEKHIYFSMNIFYVVMGLILIAVPVIISFLYKFFDIKKYVMIIVYFAYFNLLYEISALTLGWWSFNGYQFQMSILGVQIPYEELIFSIILMIPTALTYMHIFLKNDEKIL